MGRAPLSRFGVANDPEIGRALEAMTASRIS
jgi:hypothetical protein